MATKSKISVCALLFAVMALAINLRSPIVAVGPVVGFIRDELGVSGSFMGVVGALPVLAFGLFSPFVVKLVRRFGMENTLVGSIVLLIAGILLRSVIPSVWLLVLGTIILSIAISIGNVLLPVLAKQELPQRVGLVIGVMATSMALSSTLVAASVVPIAEALNWQWSLGIWVLFGLLALSSWSYIRAKSSVHQDANEVQQSANFWKNPTAWALSFFFGIQSLVIYSLMNFMPSVLVEKGMSVLAAGNYSSFLQAMCLASSILTSATFNKAKNKPLYTFGISFFYFAGVVGLWLGSVELTWLWIVFIGIGSGTFIVALNAFSLRTNNALQAAQLSGMSQAVGYTFAMLGPLGTGMLFDIFGSWTTSMGVMAALLVVECALAWIVAQQHKLVKE